MKLESITRRKLENEEICGELEYLRRM